jgi:hypothetical protein
MKRQTTLADRQEIIALLRAKQSQAAVAAATGWSIETVRKVWRAYREQGEQGLAAGKVGRPRRGKLSSFPGLVRYVALRLKRQRPHAGPDVILADMALRPSLQGLKLPSSASLSSYFSQFGERLVTPRSHRQLPGQPSQLAWAYAPHECWLLDFVESVSWPGVGWTNVMNVVDFATSLKICSQVEAAGGANHRQHMSWAHIREHLRAAFERWGLPDRIRTDHDRRLVAEGDYPVPMPFTLWLVGLGIHHELIQRVTQNGGVERANRTWQARLLDLPLGSDWTANQDYVNYETWRMNAVLPSRGRQCQRQPPLLVYPQALNPRRFYRRQDELALFDLTRVEAYLAQGRWLRHTSARGQFHFQSDLLSLGTAYARQTVVITFDLAQRQFQVRSAQSDRILLQFRPHWLSVAAITDLGETVV